MLSYFSFTYFIIFQLLHKDYVFSYTICRTSLHKLKIVETVFMKH
jgi:hypothetical protein